MLQRTCVGAVKSHQAWTHLQSDGLVDYIPNLFLYVFKTKAAFLLHKAKPALLYHLTACGTLASVRKEHALPLLAAGSAARESHQPPELGLSTLITSQNTGRQTDRGTEPPCWPTVLTSREAQSSGVKNFSVYFQSIQNQHGAGISLYISLHFALNSTSLSLKPPL